MKFMQQSNIILYTEEFNTLGSIRWKENETEKILKFFMIHKT